MNPLDWSLTAGPLPLILLIGPLFALAWLAAGRNAPRHSSLIRGADGGNASGAVSATWLAIGVPVIALAAGGVIALQRLLDMIASTMEPAYGFRSLLHFKAKFQPVYQPLYLAYPDPAALGSIATAIGRAYLPHVTSRQALRLLSKLRWPQHQGCGTLQVTHRTAVRLG
jgi:hypothetical protein